MKDQRLRTALCHRGMPYLEESEIMVTHVTDIKESGTELSIRTIQVNCSSILPRPLPGESILRGTGKLRDLIDMTGTENRYTGISTIFKNRSQKWPCLRGLL